MQNQLRIYIADDCPNCAWTIDFSAEIIEKCPDLAVDLINLSHPDTIPPDNIFATPTFVLNGYTIFLGNPSPTELTDCFKSEGITIEGELNGGH